MSEELKACPFCGEATALIEAVSKGFYRVRCPECGSATGATDSGEDAARQWNTRTPTEVEPGEAEVELVARALFDAANSDFREHEGQLGPVPVLDYDTVAEEHREFARRQARAAIAALSPTTPVSEPMLTDEEQDELVERINANPNLQPVAVDDDALVERLLRRVEDKNQRSGTGWIDPAGNGGMTTNPGPMLLVNPDGPEAAARLQSLQASVRVKDERPFGVLPSDAGICAFDRDECTVTLALSNRAEVEAMLRLLPARNRAALSDQQGGV